MAPEREEEGEMEERELCLSLYHSLFMVFHFAIERSMREDLRSREIVNRGLGDRLTGWYHRKSIKRILFNTRLTRHLPFLQQMAN